jgi:hypothetical protein
MALVGVLTGAVLTQYLAEQREKEGDFGRLRVETYQEFFSAQADFKIAKAKKVKEEIDMADFRLYESRLKMGLVGSSATIRTIVSYWDEYFPADKCTDSEKKKNDAFIYEQMRQETFELYQREPDPLELSTLARFLFLCRLE